MNSPLLKKELKKDGRGMEETEEEEDARVF